MANDKPTSDQTDEQQLAPLRAKIDQFDKQIVELLNERAKVVVEVGHVKRSGVTPIFVADREHQVLQRVRKYNEGPLPDSCLTGIWRELMSGSFALERSLRIGYLGPEASFSHMAARRKFGASVDYLKMEDIAGVFDQISRGHVDLGLVPIENSGIGGIGETLDSFLEYPVQVCSEVLLNIHHHLLVTEATAATGQIKKIYSKPEVFKQCRKWLAETYRDAERVEVGSSSKAAEIASKEEGAAAIASWMAAEHYELQTLIPNIEDNPNNITRFFVICKDAPAGNKPTGDDKTAIMFTTQHKAGALAEVIDVFRAMGLNLTHIDKRPSKRVNWEYYFFIDFVGHQLEDHVSKAIEAARKHCLQLTVLGSFPKAREVF
jgi:chorismate mutase/prephenate dehydratase